jgi:hypothetical protein
MSVAVLDHPCEACVWQRHDRCVPGGCACSELGHGLVTNNTSPVGRGAPVGRIRARAALKPVPGSIAHIEAPRPTGPPPFSNGTEFEAWTRVWCEYCVHDHDISHDPDGPGPGCELILNALMDQHTWPEAWVPEPPSLGHNLPSLIVCERFEGCLRGDCHGDPQHEARVEIVARVREAWAADSGHG